MKAVPQGKPLQTRRASARGRGVLRTKAVPRREPPRTRRASARGRDARRTKAVLRTKLLRTRRASARERVVRGRRLSRREAAPDAPRERAGEEPSVGRRPPRRRHRPGRAASCARRRRGSRKSAGGGRKVCSGARGAGLAKGVLCKRTEPGAGRFGAAWRGRKLTSARPRGISSRFGQRGLGRSGRLSVGAGQECSGARSRSSPQPSAGKAARIYGKTALMKKSEAVFACAAGLRRSLLEYMAKPP